MKQATTSESSEHHRTAPVLTADEALKHDIEAFADLLYDIFKESQKLDDKIIIEQDSTSQTIND